MAAKGVWKRMPHSVSGHQNTSVECIPWKNFANLISKSSCWVKGHWEHANRNNGFLSNKDTSKLRPVHEFLENARTLTWRMIFGSLDAGFLQQRASGVSEAFSAESISKGLDSFFWHWFPLLSSGFVVLPNGFAGKSCLWLGFLPQIEIITNSSEFPKRLAIVVGLICRPDLSFQMRFREIFTEAGMKGKKVEPHDGSHGGVRCCHPPHTHTLPLHCVTGSHTTIRWGRPLPWQKYLFVSGWN